MSHLLISMGFCYLLQPATRGDPEVWLLMSDIFGEDVLAFCEFRNISSASKVLKVSVNEVRYIHEWNY